ncbi:MAG: hypothetical protein GTO45_04830 [Candidatus Aminicenantes bacterium]|nr:hypothetical protein [Candidatus Aminicenantes bacterium]NIM78075.1 hypothetical protein [Candidatus Aminicenantes bacterium]NIN17395.1 hypothetical protein [Candidatus Aminicenantes bacterium]NIN41288.1 hypothetical protein [Candidatus Aminicenantes bacterium]NIN84061.1 hypothetical protein [Candidatus Aminicenantes bacterium]
MEEERRLDLCRYRVDAKRQFENANKSIKRIEEYIEIFLRKGSQENLDNSKISKSE